MSIDTKSPISPSLLLFMVTLSTVSAGTAPLDYRDQGLFLDGTQYTVRVPAGYTLELLTAELDQPRMLTFAGDGNLFVGSRSGDIYRLEPPYNRPQVLVSLDNYPHSVAFRPGEILIAQTDGLYQAPFGPVQQRIAKGDLSKLAALPGGGGHSSRTVAVGPDNRIYLGLGISGNCSDEYLGDQYPFDRRRGGVLVLEEDARGTRWVPFASGLRNPIGFDWHPDTKILYASNNGPDHWGYALPPEYFSRLEAGSYHGMPWFQFDGNGVMRDDCIGVAPPESQASVVPPVATFPARNAPMGVAFLPSAAGDQRLAGDAVVALHGSWATQPSGTYFGDPASRRPPKVVVVRFAQGKARRVDDLVSGFQLRNGYRWARPVGVAIGPDGAIYFSSDSTTEGLFRLKRDSR